MAASIGDYPLSLFPSSSETPAMRLSDMLCAREISKEELFHVTRALYGDMLADVVLKNAENSFGWPDTLNARHIWILLAAFGHAVTLDDFTDFLRQKREGRIKAQMVEFLPETRAREGAELSHEELAAFCQTFREPLTLFGGSSSLWEKLQPLLPSLTGPEKRSMALFRQDATVREMIAHGNPNSFAIGESLAKLVAYQKPETVRLGMLMPLYHEGRVAYYRLCQCLHSDGLHAYFWTPLHDARLEAILLFRGTNGPRSLQRSVIDRGIGKEVFEANEYTLRKWVAEWVSATEAPSLRICGHSLGGVDAQRMLAALVNHIVHYSKTRLGRLKKIHVNAYASPKLDRETVMQWRQNRTALDQLLRRPEIRIERAEHTADLLAGAGDFSIHDDTASVMLVSTSRRFPNPHRAHSLALFDPSGAFDPQDDRSFIVIDTGTALWTEEDEWLVVLETVRELAAQFELLRQSQMGLRQRSLSIWAFSEGVLTPLASVTGSILRIFS